MVGQRFGARVMAGVVMALVATLGSSNGLAWSNINGSGDATTNTLTIKWTTSLTATVTTYTGTGQLYYVKNAAAPVNYSVPVAVTIGDTFQWGMQSKGAFTASVNVTRTSTIPVSTFSVHLT